MAVTPPEPSPSPTRSRRFAAGSSGPQVLPMATPVRINPPVLHTQPEGHLGDTRVCGHRDVCRELLLLRPPKRCRVRLCDKSVLRGAWREGMNWGVWDPCSTARLRDPSCCLGALPEITTPRTACGRERCVGEPAPSVPSATRRTAGQDGDPLPPGWEYTALHALRSLPAPAPARLPGGASPCEVAFPGHPYG